MGIPASSKVSFVDDEAIAGQVLKRVGLSVLGNTQFAERSYEEADKAEQELAELRHELKLREARCHGMIDVLQRKQKEEKDRNFLTERIGQEVAAMREQMRRREQEEEERLRHLYRGMIGVEYMRSQQEAGFPTEHQKPLGTGVERAYGPGPGSMMHPQQLQALQWQGMPNIPVGPPDLIQFENGLSLPPIITSEVSFLKPQEPQRQSLWDQLPPVPQPQWQNAAPPQQSIWESPAVKPTPVFDPPAARQPSGSLRGAHRNRSFEDDLYRYGGNLYGGKAADMSVKYHQVNLNKAKEVRPIPRSKMDEATRLLHLNRDRLRRLQSFGL
eukprot:TRINITY_DN34399_c0_g1_i1.p1 TRINITY_DN34399_c0_g1~~TRINITY_DN34399_c0_g1_i1.p1  ORF type:complete len:328 (-),score=77.92 TRINITY_DN34399_c0_g1_i1:144-1127(-)